MTAEETARAVKRTGRGFLIAVVLLGAGIAYNGWQTWTLDRETTRQIHRSQVDGCERSNLRILEANRKTRAARVTLDASIVVAGLSPEAYRRLGVPSTPEADRLAQLGKPDIRELRESLRRLPTVDCRAAYPPLN